MAKTIDNLNKALRENITPNNIGAAKWDHGHNTLLPMDTRSVNQLPKEVEPGISVHLKTEGVDGLTDGGAYHTMMMIRGWHDNSGGSWGQMSITANNNLWFRASSGDGSGETWFDWKKVATQSQTGELSNLQTANKTSLVDAINEVFQNVDNGKQLIASAIDDSTITKDSTFNAMSNKISEIKSNGMNAEQKTAVVDSINNLIDILKL